MILVPTTRDEANAFVVARHRHSGRVTGHRFALAAELDGSRVGVAIVARPTARALQTATAAEVVRLCTDGTPNACSFLYGACWRAWRAMGGLILWTYTTEGEPGTSLRAAGATLDAILEPRQGWDTPTRPRIASAAPRPGRKRWVWRVQP